MVKVKLNRHTFELALSRKNLSQRDLADQMGFSRSHLSHILSGRRDASPVVRRLLLEHLPECTFDDLFSIDETADEESEHD